MSTKQVHVVVRATYIMGGSFKWPDKVFYNLDKAQKYAYKKNSEEGEHPIYEVVSEIPFDNEE